MGYEKSKALSSKKRRTKKKTSRVADSGRLELDYSNSGDDRRIQPTQRNASGEIYESDGSQDSGQSADCTEPLPGTGGLDSVFMGNHNDTGHHNHDVGLRPLEHDAREGLDDVEVRGSLLHEQQQRGLADVRSGHLDSEETRQESRPELLHNEFDSLDSGYSLPAWDADSYRGLADFIAHMQEFFAEWAAIHSDCMDAKVDYPFEEWEVDFYELSNGFIKNRYKSLVTPPWVEGD